MSSRDLQARANARRAVVTVVLPPEPESKGGWSRRLTATWAVVATIIATATTVWATNQNSDTTLASTQQGAGEQRAKETREKVSQVYADYLKAATTYRDRTFAAADAIASQQAAHKPYRANSTALSEFNDARRAYQDRINQIAIYGSPEAWKAHELIASAMPPALGVVYVKRPSLGAFSKGYREFVAVFCKEAGATPKQGCEAERAVGATR